MCGRYYLDTLPETLMEYFSVSGVPSLATSFNVAPTHLMPIVVQGQSGRESVEARWGLIPSWAKDPKIGNRMINARSETVAEKPAYRSAWKHRRCLVPASGFFEWQRQDKASKQPWVITGKEQPLLAFGGLWEQWRQDGQATVSFSILTTQPNSVVRPIHDRMPVIVSDRDFERWLTAEAATLGDCLVACDGAILDTYPVGTAVNKPVNNSPELLRPVALNVDD